MAALMTSALETPKAGVTGKPAPYAGVPPLEYRHVWYSYGAEPVVEDINFSVKRGEFMAILGPNGSGKTTLLKLALGLLKPTKGEVLLFGQQPERFRDWSKVGYVPQRTEALQSRFPATVREVVGFGLYRGPGLPRFFDRTVRVRIDGAMESAGIARLARHRVSELSVGQQQRMLLARALVRRPEILLLDEPVAGVDAAGQEQFHALMRRLNQEVGLTIVIVSHDIGAVMREASSCACINCAMVFHGPVHQITSKELSDLYGFPVDVLVHDARHEHLRDALHEHR
jgi:zinc transport system ATP-binding protein